MGELGDFLEEWEDDEAAPRGGSLAPTELIPLEKATGRQMLGPGIYFLIFAGKIVYVGKARDLLARLYQHRLFCKRAKKGKPLPPNGPTSTHRAVIFSDFYIYPCKESDLDRLEKYFLNKYQPSQNTIGVKKTLVEAGFDFTRLGVGSVKATPIWRRL